MIQWNFYNIKYLKYFLIYLQSISIVIACFSVLNQSEEHQGIMWALVFFLLEHAEDTPPDTEAPAVLELVLSLVTSQNISYGLHQTLLQVKSFRSSVSSLVQYQN